MFKKSLLLMLLMALFMPWAAKAQTTVTIGEGTATTNKTPIGTYYNYSITEQLYTAEEIGMAGTITSISFYYMGTAAKDLPITVYMSNVDAADLSTGISLADADEVFDGTLSVTTTAGWVTINLDNPFAYDGTSNLLIGVNKDYVYYFSGNTWQGTAMTPTMARYTENDYNAYTTSTVPATASNRPNIQMVITPSSAPVCNKPDTMEASNVTSNSATLTWTGGSGTYNVEYQGGTVTEWTSYLTNTTATTANLTGLTPGTTYQYRVQSVCSDGVSSWKTVSFMTMFGIPLVEPFNATSAPTGWSMGNGLLQSDGTVTLTANSYAWSFGTGNGLTDNHAKVNIYGNYQKWLILPALAMENNVELLFDLALTVYTSSSSASPTAGQQADDKFIVLISTDNGTTWQVLRQWDNTDSEYVYDEIPNTYQRQSIDLSNYAGNNVIIAFYGESTESGGDNNMHLDNVSIDYIPSCRKPENLAVSNITNHTAELSWTETGEATEWIISVNDKELDDPATENPFVLTELDPETEYTVKVRASCGNDDYSAWSNEITFSTDIACPAPTNVAVSNIAATSATVSWTGVGESYNLRYRAKTADEYATITFAPNDVWQDGTGYQLLLDADATAYGTIIPESGGLTTSGNATAATYAAFEYKIPENADGAMNTTNVLIGESVTILIPAGTYDWCVTNPTPGDRIWIAGEGRGDDLVIEAGKTYEFVVQSNGEGGDEVVINESGTATTVTANWTEINGVTSPYTISVEAEKDYIVEVLADCDADGTSAWASANFTTPSNCQVPTPLDVTDITAYTATLNWTGVQDNYQVQYRTKGSRELLFFEDFDNQPSTWTLTNAAYDRTSSQTSDYFVYLGYNTTETAYLITPELTINGAGTVEFKHRSYNGDATFQVGFSSTTNDVDAFTWGQEVSAAGVFFEAYSVAMPSGTKYVAIQSTTSATDNYVLINEFGIYGNEIPAGDWTTSTVNNATSCAISGLSGDKEYEWHVRGVNSSCDGGYTEWSTMATFETVPSCIVPTDFDYESTTGGIVLTWASEAASFDIKLDDEVYASVSDTTYTLTFDNLNPETIYEVSVRAHCDVDDYSAWTESLAFVTDCGGAKDLPYEFGFENQGEYYACWSQYNTNTTNSMGIINMPNNNLEAYEGDYAFMFSSYSSASTYDQYLFSPELNAENEITVEFYYRSVSGYGSGEEFNVGYSTDGSSFTWGDTISTTTTTWTQYLDTVPAGTKYVAIHYFANYQYYLVVDGFKFEEVTSGNTVTFNLNKNWNWFSMPFAVDDPEEGLIKLQEALGEYGLTIKDKGDYTTYEDEEWGAMGELEELVNEKMYMIQTSAACTIELDGTPADPTEYTIDIIKGWNWIGFPSLEVISIEDAFADFEPAEGDIIKEKGEYSKYEDGEWGAMGDLEELTPGQGYMYYSNSNTPKELVFSTGSAKTRNTMGQKTVINKTMGNQVIKPGKLVNKVTNIKEKTQNNEKQNDQARQMFKHK